jgi:hypothetical protein
MSSDKNRPLIALLVSQIVGCVNNLGKSRVDKQYYKPRI